ncbi:YceI family protein [Mycobacterium hodleri]|uniref:YceI family protein n=1 Tax=Mycolicibacterium hodleri TaxID=49897 RepID=UPI0027E32DEA|nr:YceI family protein [Mycolicibacterium hodleri]MCV7133989.1 YceI family protein [Mycolicibacterium hodleri]
MTGTPQYAIVGTGSIGTILAQRFSDHHVPTLWANTRGPETIDVTELSASVTPTTLDTALDADVIVLAIPFLEVRELGGRRTDWSGKVVVDTTNAFLVPNSEQILGGRLSTEYNAEAFPGAAVVKSFNQTAARQLAEKRPPEFGKRVVFAASNDSAASTAVAGLCTDLGFAPIELGRLDEGGVLIQARNALVLRELYELPTELEKSVEATSAVGRDLTPGTWTIDPVHSSITFSVRHLMVGKVRGRFGDFSGSITLPENGTPSITATIAVGSVDTGNPARDEHLRAPDVFGADEFPAATLVSVDMHGTGQDDWVLVIDFTLRGITKRLPLAFSFLGVSAGMGHGEVAGFDGAITLRRSDFGVLTDTPLLAGGGPMLGDTVDVTVSLEAVKAPAAPTV